MALLKQSPVVSVVHQLRVCNLRTTPSTSATLWQSACPCLFWREDGWARWVQEALSGCSRLKIFRRKLICRLQRAGRLIHRNCNPTHRGWYKTSLTDDCGFYNIHLSNLGLWGRASCRSAEYQTSILNQTAVYEVDLPPFPGWRYTSCSSSKYPSKSASRRGQVRFADPAASCLQSKRFRLIASGQISDLERIDRKFSSGANIRPTRPIFSWSAVTSSWVHAFGSWIVTQFTSPFMSASAIYREVVYLELLGTTTTPTHFDDQGPLDDILNRSFPGAHKSEWSGSIHS